MGLPATRTVFIPEVSGACNISLRWAHEYSSRWFGTRVIFVETV